MYVDYGDYSICLYGLPCSGLRSITKITEWSRWSNLIEEKLGHLSLRTRYVYLQSAGVFRYVGRIASKAR